MARGPGVDAASQEWATAAPFRCQLFQTLKTREFAALLNRVLKRPGTARLGSYLALLLAAGGRRGFGGLALVPFVLLAPTFVLNHAGWRYHPPSRWAVWTRNGLEGWGGG